MTTCKASFAFHHLNFSRRFKGFTTSNTLILYTIPVCGAPRLSILWSTVEGTRPRIRLNCKKVCVSVLHIISLEIITESMVEHTCNYRNI